MAAQGETKESTRIRIREPKQYKVIMHNDDFTTMDFVVDILRDIFHKDEMEAERLMLLVHELLFSPVLQLCTWPAPLPEDRR